MFGIRPRELAKEGAQADGKINMMCVRRYDMKMFGGRGVGAMVAKFCLWAVTNIEPFLEGWRFHLEQMQDGHAWGAKGYSRRGKPGIGWKREFIGSSAVREGQALSPSVVRWGEGDGV